MTGAAIKSAVLALVLPQLLNLLCVACYTGVRYLARKRHIQRHMRIMTPGAVFKFEVCLSGMALHAFWDKPVNRVACRTAKGAVLALMVRQLANLLSVTVKADVISS